METERLEKLYKECHDEGCGIGFDVRNSVFPLRVPMETSCLKDSGIV